MNDIRTRNTGMIDAQDEGDVRTVPSSCAEEMINEMFCLAVGEVVNSISNETGLGEQDVLEILQNLCVGKVGEIGGSIVLLKNIEQVNRIGALNLGMVIEKTILVTASLAEIDADELARILTRSKGVTVKEIAHWLRNKGRSYLCGIVGEVE